MSYILDALRRADAERVRGAVPTLHAQPQVPPPRAVNGEARALPWRWLLIGAVLCALLALVGWLATRRPAALLGDGPVRAVTAPLAAPAVPLAPAPPPPVAPAVESAAEASAAPPAVLAPVITLPMPAPAPAPAPAAPALPARPVAGAALAPSPVASVPATASGRLPLLVELPDELRRQLPALVFSGSVYSDQPASRFVMINGQLLREGDSVAPGLLLERIQPKSVLLHWRDKRFEAPY